MGRDSLIILSLGQGLVFDDLWLNILLPLIMSESLGLGNTWSSIFDGIAPAWLDDCAIEGIVVRTGQVDIGSSIRIVVGGYMRCDSVAGMEVWFADFRCRLVAFVKGSRTSK